MFNQHGREKRWGRDLRHIPHLAERMVECALETGAQVVPVSWPAAEVLAEHDGVAAILRW